MAQEPKFLSADTARRVVEEMIRNVFHSGIFQLARKDCHVVIIVPSIQVGRSATPGWLNYEVGPSILHEQSFGDPMKWEKPFDQIARAKALQLWDDRNDDRTNPMPHLLFSGDTPFWGGVKRQGIVVACSGFQSWYDKMVSGMIADACIAIAYDKWMNDESRVTGLPFIP